MNNAATANPQTSPVERAAVAIILTAVAGLVLWRAPAYLRGTGPLGDDSSSHIVAIFQLAEYIQKREFHLWNPAFNLGYPLAHYYQPLPYVVSAVLALALGGPMAAITAYKLCVVVILVAMPFAYYLAFARLGLGTYVALFAGLLSVTISSDIKFGLSHAAYFDLGLYSQLFGALFLPLAFAEGVRYIRGDGRVSAAVLSLTGLYFSHSFMGTAMVPILVLAALVNTGSGCFLGRFSRLCLLGGLFAAVTAFWTLPMLLSMEYMGGWPWVSETHKHGFAIGDVLTWYFQGDLTDHERLPIILVLSCIGLVVSQLKMAGSAAHRVLIASLAISTFFLCGRTTFGPIVNWLYPPNITLPLERYLGFFHFFIIAAAAVGGGWCVERICRDGRWRRLPLLFCVQFALPALLHWNSALENGLTTRGDAADEKDFRAINTVLASEPTPGRYYTAKTIGHGSHWDMYLPALYSGKPGGVSLGSGYHDCLNFYYLDLLRLRTAAHVQRLLELYNIRYLIMDGKPGLDNIVADIVAAAGPYELRRISGQYGYFQLLQTPRVLEAKSPRLARDLIKTWLESDDMAQSLFLRWPAPMRLGFQLSAGDPSLGLASDPAARIIGDDVVPVPAATLGDIVGETIGKWRYACTVRANDSGRWLLLKVTAHPFWKAYVDGAAVDVYQLSPAYMGVPLSTAGEHQVRFEYQHPAFQKWLVVLAVAIVATMVIADLLLVCPFVVPRLRGTTNAKPSIT